MKKILTVFLICCVLGCTDSQGPNLPTPAKVRMVERSPDLAAVEKGIDAVPENDWIRIQWHDLKDPNLKSYVVWRKIDGETHYRPHATIDLDIVLPGEDTTYTDTDIRETDLNRLYYNYFVTAVNDNGERGQPSDTIRYKLLEKSDLVYPGDLGISLGDAPLIFRWWFRGDVIQDQFILRIEDELTGRLHFSRIFGSDYAQFNQELEWPPAGIENPPEFIPGAHYRWRIDVLLTAEPSEGGSESNWLIFSLQ